MKKILMILAPNDFMDPEYSIPKTVFEKEKYKITTTSSEKLSIGKQGLKVEHKGTISYYKNHDFDALVFVGGTGCLSLIDNEDLKILTKRHLDEGKIVASICLAPRILLKWGFLEGRKVTGYDGDDKFKKLVRGGKAILDNRGVVVDGNIVTGSGPDIAEQFALEIIDTINLFHSEESKKKKRVLLFHGWKSTSVSHWYPWFREKVESKGWEIMIPDLPNPDAPVMKEQVNFVDKYKDYLKAGDVLLGHSVGAKLALLFIEKYKLKGLTVLLLAPTYPGIGKTIGRDILGDAYESMIEYVFAELNFDKLGNKYMVLVSEDDSMIYKEELEAYFSKLENVEFIYFKDKGHFTNYNGVLKLEEIFDYI